MNQLTLITSTVFLVSPKPFLNQSVIFVDLMFATIIFLSINLIVKVIVLLTIKNRPKNQFARYHHRLLVINIIAIPIFFILAYLSQFSLLNY